MTLKPFATADSGVIAQATGEGRFETEIRVRDTRFLADEPVEVGGGAKGPTPFELLSAALASCTTMTLRLYAERKGWTLPPFSVEVAHSLQPGGADGSPPRDHFSRLIHFGGDLDEEMRTKLLEIADKCPVHRTLMRGFAISTGLAPPDVHPAGEPVEAHEKQMEQACSG